MSPLWVIPLWGIKYPSQTSKLQNAGVDRYSGGDYNTLNLTERCDLTESANMKHLIFAVLSHGFFSAISEDGIYGNDQIGRT